VGKFVIPFDFIVMDMDEHCQVPIILGRPLFATIRAVIDVRAGTIFFQLCGEKVDFFFSQPTTLLLTTPVVPMVSAISAAVSEIEVL